MMRRFILMIPLLPAIGAIAAEPFHYRSEGKVTLGDGATFQPSAQASLISGPVHLHLNGEAGSGVTVDINLATGEVKYTGNVNAAARLFWKTVGAQGCHWQQTGKQ